MEHQSSEAATTASPQRAARIGYFISEPLPEMRDMVDRMVGDKADRPPNIWQRPGLRKAVSLLKRGDTLVIPSLASVAPWGTILAHALQRQGKYLECIRTPIEVDEAILQIDNMVDQGRSGGKQARVRNGGRQGGPAPYGFLPDGDTYRWDDQSGRGKHLVWIMRQRQSGLTYERVSDILNECGVAAPRGGTWSHSTTRRVINQAKRLVHLIPAPEVFG